MQNVDTRPLASIPHREHDNKRQREWGKKRDE